MVAFAALVVKLPVPPAVTNPACVMLPVVAVALRLFPTVDALKLIPVVLVKATLPAPTVFTSIAPVTARLFSVIELPPAAVKLPVPPAVTMPDWVILPAVAVAVRLRPMFEV